MKKLNKKGFTLIELIVVIGILAVLAVILVPSIMNYVAEAREARNVANARALYSEVAAQVAFGTITAGDEIDEGGVNCEYEVANGVVSSFECSIGTGGNGTFTDGAATITLAP